MKDQWEKRRQRLKETREKLEERHWCGSQGFGLHWSDVCPKCEANKKQARKKE